MKMRRLWVAVMLVAGWLSGGRAETDLAIRGSETFGEDLGPKLVALFLEQYPHVKVELTSLGSASGIADLLDSTCDLAVSSRLFNDDEQRLARSRGLALKYSVAGYCGVGVVVNEANPLQTISDRDIREIFTGRLTNWQQLGGPDLPIVVCIRDASAGTHLGFRMMALNNNTYAANAQVFTGYRALADAVAAQPGAIGYVGMDLLAHPGLHSVAINGIPLTEVTVHEGVYPYVESLLLYTRVKAADPSAERFVQLVRSPAGQEVVRACGFVTADLGPLRANQIFFLLFQVLGGLALFIYGMHVMTRSLRTAAGSSLRSILASATRSRGHGVIFGTVVGFLAHTGAAITMLAGFINAGVMTLEQAIAPVFGANIGTTLSMQLVSFRITDYCWAAIGIGFLRDALIPSERLRKLGDALIGFGLLFLGMETISAGIAPHKDMLAPYLVHIRGDVWTWRLMGVLISALLTALMTSSGAMIGLCFALVKAGVFTRFDQVAVVVLGAHIGTCIVPIMASLSMRIGAWRAAIAHLVFNIANVLLALAAWPLFVWVCEYSAPDNLLRQAANLHTFAMVFATAALLPFTGLFTRLVRGVTPSKEPVPAPSFLDTKLLAKPEQALAAVIRELRRMAEVCVDSMMLNGQLTLSPNRKTYRRLLSNEEIINEVRLSLNDYLERLTQRYLSRRQALFVQHLDRCMKDIERIGDHLTHIGATSLERFKIPEAIVPEDLFRTWFNLLRSAKRVITLMAKSFDPDANAFQTTALEILRARDAYMILSMDAKAEFAGAARDKRLTPIGGYYLSRYIEDLDRLVRRAKSIAFAERQPDFWLKQTKLERDAKEALAYTIPPLVSSKEYLESLSNDAWDETELMDETPHYIPTESPHLAPPDEQPHPAAPAP